MAAVRPRVTERSANGTALGSVGTGGPREPGRRRQGPGVPAWRDVVRWLVASGWPHRMLAAGSPRAGAAAPRVLSVAARARPPTSRTPRSPRGDRPPWPRRARRRGRPRRSILPVDAMSRARWRRPWSAASVAAGRSVVADRAAVSADRGRARPCVIVTAICRHVPAGAGLEREGAALDGAARPVRTATPDPDRGGDPEPDARRRRGRRPLARRSRRPGARRRRHPPARAAAAAGRAPADGGRSSATRRPSCATAGPRAGIRSRCATSACPPRCRIEGNVDANGYVFDPERRAAAALDAELRSHGGPGRRRRRGAARGARTTSARSRRSGPTRSRRSCGARTSSSINLDAETLSKMLGDRGARPAGLDRRRRRRDRGLGERPRAPA